MFFGVDFGSGNTGLVGTVGYTQTDRTGATVVARTTAGISEIGSTGQYVIDIIPASTTIVILWDTGGGTPIFASNCLEDINTALLRNRQETDPGTGIRTIYDNTGVALYTAAIFQDVAGAVPYSGGGINRTNRFT